MYKAVARLLMTKAQYRLIDGALYKREPRPYCYDFIVHDLGHGQAEHCRCRVMRGLRWMRLLKR